VCKLEEKQLVNYQRLSTICYVTCLAAVFLTAAFSVRWARHVLHAGAHGKPTLAVHAEGPRHALPCARGRMRKRKRGGGFTRPVQAFVVGSKALSKGRRPHSLWSHPGHQVGMSLDRHHAFSNCITVSGQSVSHYCGCIYV
jgi:hypothetical protein